MIVCDVCPRRCRLDEGQVGFCNVRKNVNGENIDSLYGLFYPYPEENNRVAPGSYTIVFPGCNLKCWFCFCPFVSSQFNGNVSEWPGGAYRKLAPVEVVEKVKKNAGPERDGFRCGMMGLFGGEPSLHYEYILESARACREAGCVSKMQTNGYISEDILRRILDVLDIISINVKASGSPSVYQRLGADSDVVFRNLEQSWKTPNVRTVVRDLVGPNELPSRDDDRRFSRWLREHVSPSIPIFIERAYQPKNYFPDQSCESYLPPIGVGEEDGFMSYVRCRWVGLHLTENGLENVQTLDPRLAPPLVRQIPRVNLEETSEAVADYGGPKDLTVARIKFAEYEFVQEHAHYGDPYGQLILPQEIELALRYGIAPENVLNIHPRIYKSLLEQTVVTG